MKVDVILQVYGKPWQTLCTLESLMTYSEQWIDKIYLIEEAKHPYGDNIDIVFEYDFPIVHKKNEKWVNIYAVHRDNVPYDLVRHQFGIDNSNKKHVFITHNDVLYTKDVVGEMLNLIQKNEKAVGVGEIGQCWNCPALQICGGGKNWDNWSPTFNDVTNLNLPYIRTRRADLDQGHPKLMPECRLNEWACLINREICKKEGKPYFGDFNHDSGTEWFKSMYKKGYKFIDYREGFEHCYWAKQGGYNVQQNEDLYWKTEENAKEYFKQNFE